MSIFFKTVALGFVVVVFVDDALDGDLERRFLAPRVETAIEEGLKRDRRWQAFGVTQEDSKERFSDFVARLGPMTHPCLSLDASIGRSPWLVCCWSWSHV
jgi:hypothetical protein